MGEIPIVIPTYLRAGRVTALRLFPDATLAVRPGAEADAYRSAYPGQPLLVLPPHVQSLPETRQWLWTELGDVCMVDDDVTTLFDCTAGPGETRTVPPADAPAIVQRTADTARQLGCVLFGFAPNPRVLAYDEHRPFSLTGRWCAHVGGVLGGRGLWMRRDIAAWDDVWLSCLNAYTHRWLLTDHRYAFDHAGTFRSAGGNGAVRTGRSVRAELAQLLAAFGSALDPPPPGSPDDALPRMRLPF